jgi:U3 small nucleolar RNA-associated protein MPP10
MFTALSDTTAALREEAASIRHITELLASLSPAQAPQTRSQAKRKRSPSPTRLAPILEPTPIATLHVEGMDEEQVWAQLELKNKSLCETLQYALDASGEDPDMLDDEAAVLAGNEEDSEVDSEEEEEEEESSEGFEEDDSDDDEDEEDEDEEEDGLEDEDLGESVTPLRDPEDEAAAPPTLFARIDAAIKKPPRRSGKQSEVDDDFFSLAEFNAETKQAEARKASRGALGGDDEEDEDEEMEDIDLFNAIDDDAEDDGEGQCCS